MGKLSHRNWKKRIRVGQKQAKRSFLKSFIQSFEIVSSWNKIICSVEQLFSASIDSWIIFIWRIIQDDHFRFKALEVANTFHHNLVGILCNQTVCSLGFNAYVGKCVSDWVLFSTVSTRILMSLSWTILADISQESWLCWHLSGLRPLCFPENYPI